VAYFWEYAIEATEVSQEVELAREKIALREAKENAMQRWMEAHPCPQKPSERLEWNQAFLLAFPGAVVKTRIRDDRVQLLAHMKEFPAQHFLQLPADRRREIASAFPKVGPWELLHDPLIRGESTPFATVPAVFHETGAGLNCHTWIGYHERTAQAALSLFAVRSANPFLQWVKGPEPPAPSP